MRTTSAIGIANGTRIPNPLPHSLMMVAGDASVATNAPAKVTIVGRRANLTLEVALDSLEPTA